MRSDRHQAPELPDLPPPPQPQGAYLPAIASGSQGGVVLTAGMTPRVDGELAYGGQVGAQISLDEARRAAAIAADNALSAALSAVPAGARLGRVLRLTVYVNAVPGFTQHSAVADGASRRLADQLGGAGAACRSAVGVASLPGGACVELELTCSWESAGG